MIRPLGGFRQSLLVLLWLSSSARAGEAVVLVGDEAACPAPAAVARALQAILPDATVGREGLEVVLSDEGEKLLVSAGGSVREFNDPGRRCDERARKAAVFIALVLQPPTVQPRPVPPPPPPLRLPSVELGAAALFDAAPEKRVYSGGAELSLFVGARYLGGVLSVSGLSPTILQLNGVRARLTRIPFELAVRGRLRRGRVGLALDAGVVIGGQITEGLDVPQPRTESRVEAGVRLAARVEFLAGRRLVPFLAFRAEVIPQPYNLILPSAGVVGTTPQYWLGGALGIAIRIR